MQNVNKLLCNYLIYFYVIIQLRFSLGILSLIWL